MIRTRPLTFVAAFLFFSTASYTQESEPLQQTTDVTTLTFLSPGIGYEKAINKFTTLYGSFSLYPTFYYWSGFGGSETHFHLDPGLTLQYRYYYNFYGRSERGRRTDMNSANYIAPVLSVVFTKNSVSDSDYGEVDRRAITTLGGVWGMQRNYRKRFSLDLNLGIGYYFTKGTTLDGGGNLIKVNREDFTYMGGLSLGFWINKRK
jgi:hypothetical protein